MEFRCRFMDSLHRLVKQGKYVEFLSIISQFPSINPAALRGVIKNDVIPTINRLIERSMATPDWEGEATHERLLDACVRALHAVIVNDANHMVPDAHSGMYIL